MKRRITLGLAPLFLLIVAMGLYAVVLFAHLGARVDVILRENFRSVVAGQAMKEAAERMDSALSFALAGEEERGRNLFAQSEGVFIDNLRAELNNITLPGEGALSDQLKTLHAVYLTRAQEFWATASGETRRKMYFEAMLPAFTELKEGAQAIIRINQENMVQAARDARRLSDQSTRYMAAALVVGLAGATWLAVRLQRAILRPIAALTTASKELGEGKLGQVLAVPSDDELGQLADTFNKMATRLRAARQSMGDQVVQARQMTEVTFSAFPDPIMVLGPDGQHDFSNPAAIRFLDRVASHGILPQNLQVEVDRVFNGSPDYVPQSFERVLVFRVEDRELFVLPRVIGIRDDAGLVSGAAVVLQDVTHLRLLDEVKTNLVSTVSHELKTPLTSVRMGLHLLLEERIGALNGKQTELLLAAREDSERLLRMINDLLDLAKLESGKNASVRKPVEARQLVEHAAEALGTLVSARGARLVTEIAAGLPKVWVDAQQITHVFSNFISNAIKHTAAGAEIALRANPFNERVRFSVADHGPGIPAQYQARIFDRFFRVPGSEITGAGLGLAIAKEVVQAQGGVIGVRSAPGEGSEFYFDLPAAGGEAAA